MKYLMPLLLLFSVFVVNADPLQPLQYTKRILLINNLNKNVTIQAYNKTTGKNCSPLIVHLSADDKSNFMTCYYNSETDILHVWFTVGPLGIAVEPSVNSISRCEVYGYDPIGPVVGCK